MIEQIQDPSQLLARNDSFRAHAQTSQLEGATNIDALKRTDSRNHVRNTLMMLLCPRVERTHCNTLLIIACIAFILSCCCCKVAANTESSDDASAQIAPEWDADTEAALARLLVKRFAHLFDQQQLALSLAAAAVAHNISTSILAHADGQNANQTAEEPLEVRRANQVDRKRADQSAATSKAQQQQQPSMQRNYFRVLDRVFSRVELPEPHVVSRVFAQNSQGSSANPLQRGTSSGLVVVASSAAAAAAAAAATGAHCMPHVGCVDELPNLPSLLIKRSNVTSSFTFYTASGPKTGYKILYEPIVHHQLADNASSIMANKDAESSGAELPNRQSPKTQTGQRRVSSESRLKQQQQQQHSWLKAVRVMHTQELPFSLASLEASGFNSSHNTRIIVGGYFAKDNEHWIDELVRQWQQLEPHSNIIKVSWSDANRGLYHTAAHNSRIVARQLSLLLYYLNQMFAIDLSKFHIVGHSLGAHIAGFVGADNGGKVARITGLDPAGPIFVELDATHRLDPADARFVDVLHTNGGPITKGALGLSEPLGHVDYYANGGAQQPGCYFSSVTKSILDPVERVACSHRRSYRYFIELIRMAIQHKQAASNESTEARAAGDDAHDETLSTHHRDLPITRNVWPRAFLFDARNDELARLVQPEIALVTWSLRRRDRLVSSASLVAHVANAVQHATHRSSQADAQQTSQTDRHTTTTTTSSVQQANARQLFARVPTLRREPDVQHQHHQAAAGVPVSRPIEFHTLKSSFPHGNRGLYYFRTRDDAPYFASKQWVLALRTDANTRRKLTLSVRLDGHAATEAELDEMPGAIVFVPNDERVSSLLDASPVGECAAQQQHAHDTSGNATAKWIPQLSLMWRNRGFNLQLVQPQRDAQRLYLSDIEMSLLDCDQTSGATNVIRYWPYARTSSSSANNVSLEHSNEPAHNAVLVRNQWHKFEGRFELRPYANV